MTGFKGSWTRAGLLPLAAITVFMCQQAGKASAEQAPVSAAPSAPAPANSADAEGIIFERQQIMKQLDTDTDTLGSIIAGEIPKDKLVAVTRSIAQGARQSVTAFQQKVPGGRAKPEVWSNYADYSQRMENFARSAEQLAKDAETGNMTAVVSTMGDALPCKQCHDVYREKKRS
ncbi:MAG TPA: cytochrome c [Sphingobium sp.]|uniref:c-type cytochrome n=1 Tax=Sphingobium sp. TaxID=1912891 RepID=UPI002ED12EEC